MEFVDEVRGWVEEMGYRKDVYFTKVRPYKVDGVPQLRAEVKRKDGREKGWIQKDEQLVKPAIG